MPAPTPGAPLAAPVAGQVDPVPADRRVRWGFLTAARIANKWATALNLLPEEAELVAVAARDAERASSFAREHGVREALDDYHALVERDDLDVVYVASPHSHHLEHALLAIRAGKNVLVEKPLTPCARDSLRLLEAAAEHGVFCMEGMWTRSNPLVRQARDLVERGVVGDPLLVQARFPTKFVAPDDHRIFNPELAGGAVLDLGVYAAHVTHALLGVPDEVSAVGTVTRTGVDSTSLAQLVWRRDSSIATLGTLATTLEGHGEARLELTGTNGTLVLENFVKPETMHFIPNSGETQRFVTSFPPGGYTFQAQEVHRCLQLGRAESGLVPWQSTLDVAWVMDEWIAGVHRSAS